MAKRDLTREEYLLKAVDHIHEQVFKPKGYKIPKVKATTGFPKGQAEKVLGQFWNPNASDDKVGSIFMNPTVSDTEKVLGILTHELVHACVGTDEGHGPVFKKCALAIGLEGQMRSCLPGKNLNVVLKNITKKIGSYPHARLNLTKGPVKKQTTRMIKMYCNECEYKCRASATAIRENGPVICPCNNESMEIEKA